MKKLLLFLICVTAFMFVGCADKHDTEYNYPDFTKSEATEEATGSITEKETVEITQAPAETDAPVVKFEPEKYLSEMTIEEKIGQMFLAGYPDADAVGDVSKYKWGGYILFAKDVKNDTKESLKDKLGKVQSVSDIPLLIAVDEEGGDVCRLSLYSAFRDSKFLSPRDLYNIGGMDRLKQEEWEKSLLLSSVGFNVNMAPVCDISTQKNAFMYRRSLGQNEFVTSEFVSYVVACNAFNKVGSVLKHFPGYGENDDTHTDIVFDRRPLSDYETKDLIPFYAGIENDCAAILFSHTIVECFDKEHPVSLSHDAHKYAREKMGFDGVIVTDDIVMRGVTNKYGLAESAVLAVLAGNDLICTQAPKVHYDAVCDAVKNGRISEEQIDCAVSRVLNWKYALGLIE